MKTSRLVRIAIRFLLLISFLAGTLYYGWLTFSLFLSRTHAKNAVGILSGENTSRLKKIPVADLDNDESDEVWFNGNLYDVVKRESIKDTDYVFVIQDADEQEVLENISGHFRAESIFMRGQESRICLPINNCKSSDQENLIKIARDPLTVFSKTGSTTSNTIPLPTSASEVTTPPPRKSIARHIRNI